MVPQEGEPSKVRREADHANDSREASLTLVKRVRYYTTPAIESALTLWHNWQSSILLLLDNTYFAYFRIHIFRPPKVLYSLLHAT